MDKVFEELLDHLPPAYIDYAIKVVASSECAVWGNPTFLPSPELVELKMEMVKYMVRNHWGYLEQNAPDSIVHVIVKRMGGVEAFDEED